MKGRQETKYYSSIAEVMYYTNLRKDSINPTEDLDIDEEEFEERIEEYLYEAADYINMYTKRNFSNEYKNGKRIPAGIHGIARRIVADIVAQALVRKDNSFFILSDSLEIVRDTVLNSNIMKDLDLYKKKQRLLFFYVGNKTISKKSGDDDLYRGAEVKVRSEKDLVVGDLVNLYLEDGKLAVRLADSVLGYNVVGYVKGFNSRDNEYVIGMDGILKINNKNLDVGSNYYLGREGKLECSISSDFIIRQSVGQAVGEDELLFNVEEVVKLV